MCVSAPAFVLTLRFASLDSHDNCMNQSPASTKRAQLLKVAGLLGASRASNQLAAVGPPYPT